MGKKIQVFGGDICLRAAPSKAKGGGSVGQLYLDCANASNMGWSVQVQAPTTSDPNVASTAGVNASAAGVAPVVKTINGRAGVLWLTPQAVAVGTWTSVAAGSALLEAQVVLTGNRGSAQHETADDKVTVS